jgi:hypothetical protein
MKEDEPLYDTAEIRNIEGFHTNFSDSESEIDADNDVRLYHRRLGKCPS